MVETYDSWTEYVDEYGDELGSKNRPSTMEPDWDSLRTRVLRRDNWQCVECKVQADLVHHEKYTPPDVETPMEYLVSMCTSCHGGKRDYIDLSDLEPLYDEDGNMKEHHITDHMGNKIDMDDRGWFDQQ